MTDVQLENLREQWNIIAPDSRKAIDGMFETVSIETQSELRYAVARVIANYLDEGQGSGTYERAALTIEVLHDVIANIDEEY